MTKGMGITIESNFDLPGFAIPTEVEVVLYRIAQEGLTNIIRHARSERIKLLLCAENGGVKMTMEDDGVGFDPGRVSISSGQRHLGLISMRERAEIIGGTLDVYTALGKGTTVEVFIPIRQ
jgi:signal transduction histidine kinase